MDEIDTAGPTMIVYTHTCNEVAVGNSWLHSKHRLPLGITCGTTDDMLVELLMANCWCMDAAAAVNCWKLVGCCMRDLATVERSVEMEIMRRKELKIQ